MKSNSINILIAVNEKTGLKYREEREASVKRGKSLRRQDFGFASSIYYGRGNE